MSTLIQARAELAAEIQVKEQDLAKYRSRLLKLDDLLKDDEPGVTRKKPGPKPKVKAEETTTAEAPVRKKPGPKPKVKVEVEETPKVRGKPGPKPKPKAEKAEKTAGASRAAEGRRAVARGERPTLKVAMATVMGTDVCNPEMVTQRLASKGWTPSAKEPKTYIGYMLSSSKDDFERVPAKGRGFYRVKAKVAEETVVETGKSSEAKVTEEVAVKASPKVETNGAAKRGKSTDEVLMDAGIDLGGPFGGA